MGLVVANQNNGVWPPRVCLEEDEKKCTRPAVVRYARIYQGQPVCPGCSRVCELPKRHFGQGDAFRVVPNGPGSDED